MWKPNAFYDRRSVRIAGTTQIILLSAFVSVAISLGVGCVENDHHQAREYRDPAGRFSLVSPQGWSHFPHPEQNLVSFQIHQPDHDNSHDAELFLRVLQDSPGPQASDTEIDHWIRDHEGAVFLSTSSFDFGPPTISRNENQTTASYPIIGRDGFSGQYFIRQYWIVDGFVLAISASASAADSGVQSDLASIINKTLDTILIRPGAPE